ncbi:DUF2339 domain-containing protein [Arenibacter sp. GZD96]|uniref:DUF2339 domain-containing protein n=1 Tax=Aurantibrevibacter litoralis TaxID=3106030 RepID=UPI002AFEFB76|nr:DUF2339 domain-containing protein [Arenibacter sp. GZD-96]MEA1786006.1 DUF2339 domain-containing protein [Arenibacter sp. GZD-96]
MAEPNEKIDQLLERIAVLVKKQDDFSREIHLLRSELNSLKNPTPISAAEKVEIETNIPSSETYFATQKASARAEVGSLQHQIKEERMLQPDSTLNKPPKGKSNLEKFIGENLINKIGIAITVIGVGIGAKYSIENDLISPLTRIIIGYLFGLGLLGVGLKLKRDYENYSAVLVSGAMAIMYFITYFAYGLYALIPQIMAFVLMLVFTIFTVIAAISYNRQLIAHIGLVGAYAVPFLLSESSGNVAILFSYMAMLNMGILAIAFKKYWKPLYYVSFVLTWLIFLSWYIFKYQTSEHFVLALVFISIYFTLFYLIFLAYKLLQKEKFVGSDIALLVLNSFLFYGIGYTILDGHQTAGQLLGVFTLCNAMVHFIVSVLIYRKKLADKNIHYLIAGMVLIFVTIAIPVQLNGNWVTLLWAGEAALLFWIGRTKNVSFYEKLSYPLLFLAFFSILQDWDSAYNAYYTQGSEARITPLLNVHFLSSLLFIAAFVFINLLHQNKNYVPAYAPQRTISKLISFSIPAILIVTIYYAFRLEIASYWNQLFSDSILKINEENQEFATTYWNDDLHRLKTIWILNYSLLFVSILSFANLIKFKSRTFGVINLGLILLVLCTFLVQGLYQLSELRESYLAQTLAHYYQRGISNLWMRYISFSFVALALYACYKHITQDFQKNTFKIGFELLLHSTILWIASSELIHWMDIFNSEQSYKLGLSILWGLYSLFLIAFGIWKNNKPVRIGAIVLFGITLVKLFFYDISHLNTIAKTIVFVSLGLLLLVISFLYTKYKHVISDHEGDT